MQLVIGPLPDFTEAEMRRFCVENFPNIQAGHKERLLQRYMKRELSPKYKSFIISVLRHESTNYDDVLSSIDPQRRQSARVKLKKQIKETVTERYEFLRD
jgi:hypothetical protein